jgi:hypothetical protein
VQTRKDKKQAKEKNVNKTKKLTSAKNTQEKPTDTNLDEKEEMCCVCNQKDPPGKMDESDIEWVACGGCLKWCNTFCCGMTQSNITEKQWLCLKCSDTWAQ